MPSMNTDNIELNVLSVWLERKQKVPESFPMAQRIQQRKKSPSLSSSELMNTLEKEYTKILGVSVP